MEDEDQQGKEEPALTDTMKRVLSQQSTVLHSVEYIYRLHLTVYWSTQPHDVGDVVAATHTATLTN